MLKTVHTSSPALWLVLFFLVSAYAVGATYQMDFPVRLNNAEIGQIAAEVNGITLVSVSGSQLNQNLGKVFSAAINKWFIEQGDKPITVAELEAKGITIVLRSQDLVIELKLNESAMATDSLTYSRQQHVVLPNQEASWALLNNFNINHQRGNNNKTYDSTVEWLFDANIGGGDGINLHGSAFYEHSDTNGSKTYRSDFQLYYDQPQKPLRYTFGDTQNRVVGHLSSYQMGGFSINKAYAQLQPQRNLTPGNSQVFVLPRQASVEIYVNGFMISRIRLRPGRFDVNDLPLTSGSNNIHLVATYADGETERFDFTTHYNAQLLAEGLSDYSVVFGYPSFIASNTYHYDESPLVAAMYEYGVGNAFTMGVNAAVNSKGQVGGVTATMGRDWGNLSLRYSTSDSNGESGRAFTIDTEHNVIGQSQYGAGNLRLGYEKKEDFSATPWFSQGNLITNERVFFDYSYFVSDTIDANLYGSLLLNSGTERTKDFTAQLNYRNDGINVSMGYSYGAVDEVTSNVENRFFVNLTWSFYDRKNNSRDRVRYNSRTKTTTATHTKVNGNYLNDYGYELLAEKGSGTRREQLRSSYTHQLFRSDFTTENITRESQLDRSSFALNLSTSVGLADGHIGIGSNVTAPFAVVSKHQSLAGRDVLVNVNRNNRAKTKTSDGLGALINLGTGYTATQFNVDVPDAPFGYDWGPGTYRLAGGANTGHYFQVGSALSYTVLGILVDEQGEPIALKRGSVKGKNNGSGIAFNQSFFTNRVGRFVIEGIGTGDFDIQLEDVMGDFTIVESDQRFVNLGTITLIKTNTEGGN